MAAPSRALFTAVFALIVATTLLTGQRFGYGIEGFAPVQRIIPLFIGPLIYLGFLTYTRPPAQMRRPIAIHMTIWCVIALLPQVVPSVRAGYDAAIGVSYLVATISLLLLWRRGADALSVAPLDLTRGLRIWMLVAASMLAVMLVFDTAIAIRFATGHQDDALVLISAGSVVTALCLVGAIIITFTGRRSAPAPAPIQPTTQTDALDLKARAFLTDTTLYLDTDLTLERLAKRLHVPARALSEAINQTQRMNVSQYVNGFRLTHAAHLLETTDLSVTQVTEQSGFLTRSNFYREFERVFAMSPTAYRASKRASKRP